MRVVICTPPDDAERARAHDEPGDGEPGKERAAAQGRYGESVLGLDAYQKVIDSGVDVVLLATPPGFRPTHLRACIEAGKHVFCEKPIAVDAPGVRDVLETAKMAKQKNLSLVAGFCWRYSNYIQRRSSRSTPARSAIDRATTRPTTPAR